MSTKIQWCDETWNPITGCTPISEGCKNCYAQRMFGRNLWGYDFTPGLFHKGRYDTPMKWKQPKRIFVCSMGDLFHDNVDRGVIAGLAIRMKACYWHTFMLLTKRPARMKDTMSQYMDKLPNVWLGVTAENQKRADERIPILLQIPAAVRFVSVEPCLSSVDYPPDWLGGAGRYGHNYQMPQLDWLIAGPETGPGARPCKPEWIQSLADQCEAAGVPFFDKREDYIRREFPQQKVRRQ